MDLRPFFEEVAYPSARFGRNVAVISWVIVGGESAPAARAMNPKWVRSLRDHAVAAGVAFFFKQWGNWSPTGEDDEKLVRLTKKESGRLLDGRTWDELPFPRINRHS